MHSPPSTKPDDDAASLTGIFGAAKARQLRWALWIRRQFTATSLSVIVAIAGAAWAYIGHLREQVSSVTTRVVVLETEVIPDLRLQDRVSDLEKGQATNEARLHNLEDNYDFARAHAGDNPTVKPHR